MEKTGGSIEIDNTEDMLFTYSEEEKQDIEIAKANADLIFSPKYIIIQTEWLNNLSLIQSYIFGFIDYYLGTEGKRFYFTNEQIAKICKCGERTVQDSIQALEKLGYIQTSRKVKSGGGQIRFVKINNTTSKICQSDSQKTTGQTSKKLPTNNNYINNNYLNISSSNEEEIKQNTQPNKEECYCSIKEDNKDISVCKDSNKEIDISKLDCNNSMTNKRKNEIENRNEVFERIWNWYGKKDARQAAIKYFDKYIKTNYDLNLLRYALPKYRESVKDKQYLVLLRTYLSEQRYLDYKLEFDSLTQVKEEKPVTEENLITETVELDQDKLNQGYEYKDGFYVKKRNYDN